MVQLAGEYGLSDVGLAKVCRRLGIPVPGRGYWRKKEAGQDVPKLPLPPLKPGKMDYAEIDVDATKPLQPQAQERVDFEKEPDNVIVVCDDPAKFGPLAASAWHGLQKATFDQRGLAVGEYGWAKIIRVSKDSRARAARILDALLEAFRARGFQAATEATGQRGAADAGTPAGNPPLPVQTCQAGMALRQPPPDLTVNGGPKAHKSGGRKRHTVPKVVNPQDTRPSFARLRDLAALGSSELAFSCCQSSVYWRIRQDFREC